MLKIRSIAFLNFDCWQNFTLELDPSTNMIAGPNGSGKTSFIDGIRLAFNGELSSGRRLSDYILDRRKNTMVKLVVDNPREGRSRIFSAYRNLQTEQVSIGCVVIHRNGVSQKRYFILPGDAPLELVQQTISDEREWLKPGEYSPYLARAGVSRSLMQLLAIEQGETHKFCQKKPRELFQTILQAMGDHDILESYRRARSQYEEVSQDLRAATGDLNVEEHKLIELGAQRSQYREFESMGKRLQTLAEETRPRAELAGLALEAEKLAQSVNSFKGHLTDLRGRIEEKERDIRGWTERLARVNEEAGNLQAKAVDANRRLQALGEQLGGVRARREALEQLEAKVAGIPARDPAEIEREYREAGAAAATAMAACKLTEARLATYEAEVRQLEAGLPSYPDFVLQMRGELERAAISHSLLAELVEPVDDDWRVAVESALGGLRFMVLVDPRDSVKAREIGRRLKYRHYVSEYDPGPLPQATPGSLLEVVRFNDARVPGWVADDLDRIFRVKSVREGYQGLKKHQATITPDAYHQDRRGGRCIEAQDLFCGRRSLEIRLESARRNLAETRKALEEGRREYASADQRRRAADQASAEQLRRLEWQRQAPELDRRREEEAALAGQVAGLEDERNALDGARTKANKESSRLETKIEDGQKDLVSLRTEFTGTEESYNDGLIRQADLEVQIRDRRAAHPALRDVTAEELRRCPRLETVDAELGAMKVDVENFQGCRDPGIELAYVAQEHARDDLRNHVERCRSEVERGQDELAACRRDYIRVINAVVERYRRNAQRLAEIAGFKVRMAPQGLLETDDALERVELEVEVSVDGGETFRPVSTSKLSGGQRVIASLILMMSLADSGSRTGLFILDEPFAHLSMERIDEVAEFIDAVDAQFILTTPVTENATVLNTARRIITMTIKRLDQPHADRPIVAQAMAPAAAAAEEQEAEREAAAAKGGDSHA